jgi:lipoate-protein ligase B
VTDVASLRQQLDQLKDANALVFQVQRGGRLTYVTLETE